MAGQWVGLRDGSSIQYLYSINHIFFSEDYPITKVQFLITTSGGGEGVYDLILYEGGYDETKTEVERSTVTFQADRPTWNVYEFTSPLIPGQNYTFKFEKVSGASDVRLYMSTSPTGKYYTGHFSSTYYASRGVAFQTYGDPAFVRVQRWDGTGWVQANIKRGVDGQWVPATMQKLSSN